MIKDNFHFVVLRKKLVKSYTKPQSLYQSKKQRLAKGENKGNCRRPCLLAPPSAEAPVLGWHSGVTRGVYERRCTL